MASKNNNWISSAIKHPGSLREFLKKKPGETISIAELNAIINNPKSTPHRIQQANLALTMKKWK